MAKVALVQQAPAVLNKQKTLEQAVSIIEELGKKGVELAVFPEAYVPGYPAWIWRLKPGGDWAVNEELHAKLLKNAIDITRGDLKPLQDAARRHKMTIVCGVNEKDAGNSQATLFNSAVVIGSNGSLVNHHRKLMPTNPERMVWGFGDGSGLRVVDTPVGKIGTLICWENYMPQARLALYSQGVEIYIAPTYDSGEGWVGSMQHIAREGRCWVLCCGVALQRTDLPSDLLGLDSLYPADEDWINPGDSVVVAPGGDLVQGPLHKEKGYLICDIDVEKSTTAKRTLDVAGHYSRPDIFTLTVNRDQQKITVFNDK